MQRWNNKPLKWKITLYFVSLNTISIILILIISSLFLFFVTRKKIIQDSYNKTVLVAKQTKQSIDYLSYNIKAFSVSDSLRKAMEIPKSDDTYQQYLFKTSMQAAVYNIMDIDKYVQEGYIITNDNRTYAFPSNKVIYNTDSFWSEKNYSIQLKKGRIFFELLDDMENKTAFTVSKAIIDVEKGDMIGSLIFTIKESVFSSAYNDIVIDKNENFIIMDKDGFIISAREEKKLDSDINTYVLPYLDMESSGIIQKRIKNHYYIAKKIEDTQLWVLYYIDYYTILNNSIFFATLLILLGTIIVVFTVFLSFFLTRSITKPLQMLTVYIEETGKGNRIKHTLQMNSCKEINTLAKEFDLMTNNIGKITKNLYDEQNKKREYELNLLQAQINPHFLYNCLDNILGLICEDEYKSATSMIQYLGNYYRGVLSKGRNILTIREEMHIVISYMQIQLIKKEKLFQYSINIPDEILDYKIPKMVLQPLVENSILHGFEKDKKDYEIIIDATEEDNDFLISVFDNGKGMQHELEHQGHSHFGLKNIDERIKLCYGKEYGLSYCSVPEKYTKVTIHFPKRL